METSYSVRPSTSSCKVGLLNLLTVATREESLYCVFSTLNIGIKYQKDNNLHRNIFQCLTKQLPHVGALGQHLHDLASLLLGQHLHNETGLDAIGVEDVVLGQKLLDLHRSRRCDVGVDSGKVSNLKRLRHDGVVDHGHLLHQGLQRLVRRHY